MRNGKVIETCNAKEENEKSLATKMLGKRLPEIEKTGNIFKESIISFKVNKINTKYNDPFLVDLIDISFDVKEGEIFGIA